MTAPNDAHRPTAFHFAELWEATADRCADRTAIIFGETRRTYAELEDRANRLANWMAGQGVQPGEHVGIYLENHPAYLEGMLAAFKIRAVPINVNHRYVEGELQHLFTDAELVGVICQPEFVERVDAVWSDCPDLMWSLQVNEHYDQVLAAASPARPDGSQRSGDDHYVIYTGGTTGLPKGVVWRQEDAFFACVGGGDPMRLAGPVERPEEVPERIVDGSFRYLPVAPLMHAAGQWTVLSWLFAGGTVVLLPGSLDPAAVWRTVAAEQVNLITVVGDAVVRPLVDEWRASGPYDVSSLFSIGSGGAPLTPALRAELAELLPGVTLVDGFGSSETGAQGSQRLPGGGVMEAVPGEPTRFTPYGDGTVVLDDATLEAVVPGSGVEGRVARSGHIPLRYHNDPEKTAATFVEVDGVRWVLTGDRATVEADGTIRLLGRGSGCINTGGEKVFPEEVESVLKAHPSVYDAVVVGVPDDRWGSRVAAVVQPTDRATFDAEVLLAASRERLAGYKVPKQVVVVDEVVRSPAGKADLRWAASVAAEA